MQEWLDFLSAIKKSSKLVYELKDVAAEMQANESGPYRHAKQSHGGRLMARVSEFQEELNTCHSIFERIKIEVLKESAEKMMILLEERHLTFWEILEDLKLIGDNLNNEDGVKEICRIGQRLAKLAFFDSNA